MCSDDVVSFPARRFLVNKILGRMRSRWILVLAVVGIGVVLPIEVSEGVVDLSVLALIGTN